MRATKVQASLRIRAFSPEPPLLAHTSSESRGTFRQKARSLVPLNGWACAVKICRDGMLEDGAHKGFCLFMESFKVIVVKISQKFIKSHLKICLISQFSVHSLWHVWLALWCLSTKFLMYSQFWLFCVWASIWLTLHFLSSFSGTKQLIMMIYDGQHLVEWTSRPQLEFFQIASAWKMV